MLSNAERLFMCKKTLLKGELHGKQNNKFFEEINSTPTSL